MLPLPRSDCSRLCHAKKMSTLGRAVQIAYSATGTETLEEVAADFAEKTGAGPFVFAHHIELSTCQVNGQPASFDHSSAYGWWGEIMVELVREHTPPLGPIGSGVHHLAFIVENLDDAVTWCAGKGWPLILRACTKGGQEFVFCDARKQLGHFIEMYEGSQRLTEFYAYVRSLSEHR